jgi:hypothetical protein
MNEEPNSPVAGWKASNADDRKHSPHFDKNPRLTIEERRREAARPRSYSPALEEFVHNRRPNEYTMRPKRPPSTPPPRAQLELYEKYPIKQKSSSKQRKQSRRQFDIWSSESKLAASTPVTFHNLQDFLVSNNVPEKGDSHSNDGEDFYLPLRQTPVLHHPLQDDAGGGVIRFLRVWEMGGG